VRWLQDPRDYLKPLVFDPRARGSDAAAVGYSTVMSRVPPEIQAIADAAYAALNGTDVEAFVALAAEDVEFTSLVAEAEGTTFRGHQGVRAWWAAVREGFETVTWELLDVEGGDDRAITRIHIAGVLSGVAVEQTMWQAVKLRDGKLGWWATFRTEAEAREAVGL
jgi:ketosteroid isomerase-like protein